MLALMQIIEMTLIIVNVVCGYSKAGLIYGVVCLTMMQLFYTICMYYDHKKNNK